MFGKRHQIESLAVRKRLLIAESELNRVLLVREWQKAKNPVRVMARVASLALGLERLPWWRLVMKAVSVIYAPTFEKAG